MEPVFEATVVRIAVFISLILLGCLIICFFMCRKGGSHKASQLVREMEWKRIDVRECARIRPAACRVHVQWL